MRAVPKFCIITGGVLAVGALAWSATPFTFSQMVAMVKKKTIGGEPSRRTEMVRNCALLATHAVAMQEGPGSSLVPQYRPVQKPKGSAAFLATEARFANPPEKPASAPGGAAVDANPPPAPPISRSVEIPAPADNVPKPTRPLSGERRLDSAMRDTVHSMPGN